MKMKQEKNTKSSSIKKKQPKYGSKAFKSNIHWVWKKDRKSELVAKKQKLSNCKNKNWQTTELNKIFVYLQIN